MRVVCYAVSLRAEQCSTSVEDIKIADREIIGASGGGNAFGTKLCGPDPYHGSGAMTRSPSPLAWRPDFPGAPREAH